MTDTPSIASGAGITDLLSSIHALADLPGHIGAAVVVGLGAALIVVPSIAARLRGGR